MKSRSMLALVLLGWASSAGAMMAVPADGGMVVTPVFEAGPLVPGGRVYANGVATAPSGAIYVIGVDTTPGQGSTVQTFASDDHGATWERRTPIAVAGKTFVSSSKIRVDSRSRLYALVAPRDVGAAGIYSWAVWRSADGARTWQVIDEFSFNKGAAAYAYDAAFAADGTIFVSGLADDGAGFEHWIVRRSRDDGRTWHVVDDIEGPQSGSIPSGMAIDRFGDIYAAGWWASTLVVRSAITARRSRNGGDTWAFSDTFLPEDRSDATSQAVLAGSTGMWMAGDAGASGARSCMVRFSPDRGQAWKTVGQFKDGYASCTAWDVREIGGRIFLVGEYAGSGAQRIDFLKSRDVGAPLDAPWTSFPRGDFPGGGISGLVEAGTPDGALLTVGSAVVGPLRTIRVFRIAPATK